MLLQRLIVGLIGAPIVIWLVFLGGLPFTALLYAAAIYGTWEMAQILMGAGSSAMRVVAVVVATLVATAWMFAPSGHPLLVVAPTLGVIAMCTSYILTAGPVEGAISHVARAVMTALYCPLTLAPLPRIRNLDPTGLGGDDMSVAILTLMALGLPWIGDTGGYFAGRFLGKRPLAPRISPKKTVEGALGTLTITVIWCLVFFAVLNDRGAGLHYAHAVILGVTGASLGIIGDLSESLWKRDANIKDSGSLLPGHGGLLDRIDAMAFTNPYAYTYLLWFMPWVGSLFGGAK